MNARRRTGWLASLVLLSLLAACAPARKEAPKASPPTAHADERAGDAHDAGSHDDHAHDEHGHEAEGHADHDHEAHEPGVVTFSAAQQRAHGIHVVPVALRDVARMLATTGEIAENTDAEAHVSTRVPGRVTAVRKTVGDWARAGETLAVVESDELGEAQAGYLEALAKAEFATATLARQRKLGARELTARKEVLAAEHEARLAAIGLERARNRLRLMGVEAEAIARLAQRRTLDPRVAMRAPIAGVVVARHVTLGEMLEPKDEAAFTLSDPSIVWVHANLYERDLARVRPGQGAVVTTPAYPGKTYEGRVSLISTTLDKDTRTARARIAVRNADRLLKPGMFANARIAVGRGRTLVVPASAVLLEKAEAFVFVQEGPERFERRKVELDPPVDGVRPVLAGVDAGEKVVAAGAFMLKSELMKSSFGGHAH